jgi:hypothetical protein
MRGNLANPYLKPQRLADVIAAITTLGTYKFYKLDVDKWADRIGGASAKPDHWRTVFAEHPEFFRFASNQQKVSLVWRRQFPRNFDVDAEPEILADHDIDPTDDSRTSRRPLEPSEITELIGVAIRLHDRALEQKKASGWWVQLLTAFMALIGAVLGAWIGTLAA